MTTPRISGLLNNCALNCGLPTLLAAIDILKQIEIAGSMDQFNDNPVVQSYLELKNKFAEYYEIEPPEALTFERFADFLNTYSFYAKEIIFAPVFRAFIAVKAQELGYDQTGVAFNSAVQSDGSYNDLHYSEAQELFHQHFGIRLDVFEFEESKDLSNPRANYRNCDYMPQQLMRSDYPFGEVPVISLYCKGEHFELQPHENLAEANALYNKEEAELPFQLMEVHHSISQNLSHLFPSAVTTQVLLTLKKYIHNELHPRIIKPVLAITSGLEQVKGRETGLNQIGLSGEQQGDATVSLKPAQKIEESQNQGTWFFYLECLASIALIAGGMVLLALAAGPIGLALTLIGAAGSLHSGFGFFSQSQSHKDPECSQNITP